MATDAKPKAEPWLAGHCELLHPSKYVKAADLRGKDVTVIISHLTRENLIMAGGKRDRKVAVHLKSVSGKPLEKAWIVGKTVLRQIAASTGEKDVTKWSGQRATMYPTTCRGADGTMVECIRVRVRASASSEEPSAEMAAPVDARDFADEAGDAAEGDGR